MTRKYDICNITLWAMLKDVALEHVLPKQQTLVLTWPIAAPLYSSSSRHRGKRAANSQHQLPHHALP